MNFTQGEWKIKLKHDLIGWSVYANQKDIAEIRSPVNGDTDIAEIEANANLIAAAPAMYETGKRLLWVICDLCKRLNPQHADCRSCAEIEEYRKAFAKAEGK